MNWLTLKRKDYVPEVDVGVEPPKVQVPDKHTYACSILMSKDGAGGRTVSHTLHTSRHDCKEKSIMEAVQEALKLQPGYVVRDVLWADMTNGKSGRWELLVDPAKEVGP